MRMAHIDEVDLNLLPALAALLEERHVSRAAARVHLSQPAMSRILQRLRRVLGDELLVRTPNGYQLTPRAERIQGQLVAIVPRLETLFSGERFDPAEAAQTFRISGTDYAMTAFGPALFRRVFRESPHSTLRFEIWHDGVFQDAERGIVDLVFCPAVYRRVFGMAAPRSLRSERLFDDRFLCVLSRDNPLAARASLSLAEYLRCPHVVVTTAQGRQTVIDLKLESLGTPRRASLTVPYLEAALRSVPGTLLVATLPERTVALHREDPSIKVLEAPSEISTMQYTMSWHPRLDDDPGHAWLRDTVRSVTRDDARTSTPRQEPAERG